MLSWGHFYRYQSSILISWWMLKFLRVLWRLIFYPAFQNYLKQRGTHKFLVWRAGINLQLPPHLTVPAGQTDASHFLPPRCSGASPDVGASPPPLPRQGWKASPRRRLTPVSKLCWRPDFSEAAGPRTSRLKRSRPHRPSSPWASPPPASQPAVSSRLSRPYSHPCWSRLYRPSPPFHRVRAVE